MAASDSRDFADTAKIAASAGMEAEFERLRNLVESQHRFIRHLEGALAKLLGRVTEAFAAASANGPPSAPPEPEIHASAVPESPSCWPALPMPVTSIAPVPGLACTRLARLKLPIVAISVFGRDGEHLEQVVAQVADQQRASRNFVPIFLTDCPSGRAFRRHGFTFAYFPRRAYGSRQSPAAVSKLRLLERKWGISSFLVLDAKEKPEADDAGVIDFRVVAHPQSIRDERVDHDIALAAAAESVNPWVDLAYRQSGAKQPVDDRMREGASESRDELHTLDQDVELIRASGLFDAEWYRSRYPDVAESGLDPVRHYLEEGAAQGRDPSPLFQTLFYARQMIRARTRHGS